MKKNKLKIIYEPEDDVLNIWLSKKLYDYAEDENGVITHYTEADEPVYIEILFASRLFKDKFFIKKGQKSNWPESQPVAAVPHRIK